METTQLSLRGADLDPTIRDFIQRTDADYVRHRNGVVPTRAEARIVAEKVRAPWRAGGPVMGRTEEVFAPTLHGQVRLRLYDPTPGAPKPALIYVHGGGWVMFSLDTHDRLMREYAARAGICVIGVDYSLSPEVRYPVALDEVVAAVRFVRDQADHLGVLKDRIALGGDSAGANLSLAASILLRDAGESQLTRALLLNYGAFDTELLPEDRQRFGGEGYMLTSDEMEGFWDAYLGENVPPPDVLATPLRANLHDLPPAFLCVPQCDVLTGQSLLLLDRLKAANVPSEAVIYHGASHSFLEAVSISPVADRAFDDASIWLRTKLKDQA